MHLEDIDISLLSLSNRSHNALRRAKINTAAQLADCEPEDLQKIKNLGSKSINELLPVIKSLRSDPDGFFNNDTVKASVELPENPIIRIDVLDGLTAREYNLLLINGITELKDVVSKTPEQLMSLSLMDQGSAERIFYACQKYIEIHGDVLTPVPAVRSFVPVFHDPSNRDKILEYVKANDASFDRLGFSVRSKNALARAGFRSVSDILFLSKEQLSGIRSMGHTSVDEVQKAINSYLALHEQNILAFLNGYYKALISDENIRLSILKQYAGDNAFAGLSFQEFKDRIGLSDSLTEERLKENIGSLLASGEIEYVDFRCYRVYPKFTDWIDRCGSLSERDARIIKSRLRGETLEAIAEAEDPPLTRERIRQVINKRVETVRQSCYAETGCNIFDEDYFRYLYTNYSFTRDVAEQWFGFSEGTYKYLDIMELKSGKKDLNEAVSDSKLPLGLRFRIKNYLNRNRIYADGIWIDLNRADLQSFVIRKYCRETVTFDEFIQLFNDFLKREQVEIPKLYITEDNCRNVLNHLRDRSKNLLWKQNEQLRYYDIEGTDFTELIEGLDLDSFENIEISSLKLFEEHADLMEKYDIRDQYELHNLLKRITEPGSYHDLKFGKMPSLLFGQFDRDAAMLELMKNYDEIPVSDFVALVRQKYGYDELTTLGGYLSPLNIYKRGNVYYSNWKKIPPENLDILIPLLTDDFYSISEIRELYTDSIPGANPEDINSHTLKEMGFNVGSEYALKNYDSFDSYFTNILLNFDQTDISSLKRRFSANSAFYSKINELKRSLDIVEYEPNRILTLKKLEEAGIYRHDLETFCDEVCDFIDDDRFFSIESLRRSGFESDLFDYSFPDSFYASLLLSADELFGKRMFGIYFFCKGNSKFTAEDVISKILEDTGSIDMYDLISEINDTYGCSIKDKQDILSRLTNSGMKYDSILDRLYANEDLYYRELSE